MKFTVSDHAFEKHLYYSNCFEEASVFNTKSDMLQSIKLCLKQADMKRIVKKRFYFKKRISDMIGWTYYGRESYRIQDNAASVIGPLSKFKLFIGATIFHSLFVTIPMSVFPKV